MAMFAHKKNQMKTPKYVHFGSTLLYVENQEHQDDDNELEKIYKDDLSDGIASMAKEQIDAWKLEMEENKMAEQSKEATKNDSSNDTNEIDENFLKELSELCSKCLAIKSGNSRSGHFGTKTRLQPRYQTGAASRYDAKVRQVEEIEKKLRALKVTSKEMESYIRIIKTRAENVLDSNNQSEQNQNVNDSVHLETWKKREHDYS